MVAPWVVVGAGSAGCVLAARLSEDSGRPVVLLDAGPDLVAHDVPTSIESSSFLHAVGTPERVFADLTASRTTGGPRTPYLRGRGIGGSSAVNAMLALRGSADLYESWGWHDVDAAWDAVALSTEVADASELGPVDRALLAAVPDAQRALLTRHEGRRVTSAEAYLWPSRARPNLTVRADTAIDRVVFDGPRAVGVVSMSGEEIPAARVIMAAGAVHSPAILLRSGVAAHGVGDGLQDHPSVPLTLALRNGVSEGSDRLAVGSFVQHRGLQLLPMNHLGADADLGVLLVALMTPQSRAGTVRLDPDDLSGDPLIDFALLQHPGDVDALVAAVHEALGVLRTPPFADIVEQVYIDANGTTVEALVDDEAIRRWLPTVVGDYVHASSTCAMGTVVDADGAVGGYDDLFVCDASVFPTIPDANTHLPTTMLAERLSMRWRRAAGNGVGLAG